MFTPYQGEFLVSPCPAQLTLNYCSNCRAFCFANLNSPEREADEVRITGFLANLHEKGSLIARLMQQGYPVLISNLVDPFAASNAYIATKTMETMVGMGIPIAIQTRGKTGVDDVLSFLPPSHWYISIAHMNESLREQIEPGAGSIQWRLDLIPKLIEKGHKVSVGVNPIVSEWLSYPDADTLLDQLAARGCSGVWTATLHFDNKQIARMKSADRALLGESVIERARRKSMDQPTDALYQHVVEGIKARGMSHYEGPITGKTDYFQPMFDLYPKRFPVIQEFINWCYDTDPQHPLSYQDFCAALGGQFPEGVWKTREYTRSISMAIGDSLPEYLTFEQLLRVFWTEYKLNRSLLYAVDCFALWTEDSGQTVMLDDQNMPYYWFASSGWGDNKFVSAEK